MSQNFGLSGGDLAAPRGNVYDLQLRAAAADLTERICALAATGEFDAVEPQSGASRQDLLETRQRILERLEGLSS